MRSLLLAVAAFCLACSAPAARPVVVVGFSADPADPMPGRLMTSADGESFPLPRPIGEDGEWLTEVTRRGDGFAAIGLQGGVYLGDESGESWQRTRVHDAWLDALKFVPGDPAHGFLAGAGAWWHTADAGATWVKETPPGFYFEDFVFHDAKQGIGIEGYLLPARGVVWRTTDGGAAWTSAAEFGSGLRSAAANGADLWAAGDSGLLVHSSDGGIAWENVRAWPLTIDPPDLAGIDFSGDGGGFVAGSHGTIGVWDPSAKRWTFSRTGDFVLQGIFARSATDAWACGYRTGTSRGVVLRTRDGGASWQLAVESPGVFWYGIAGRRARE